jgi:conjugative relaxase-like TrwC/TraI family protein
LLTIRTITSDNAELVDYYENDEAFIDAQERYYTDSGVISETDEMTCAVWYGKAAEALELSGHATREDFVTLSRGTKPGTDERIRGKNQDKETKDRHGHDLVFSAPKSVSIALEVGGDLRLFDAHMNAVKATMDLAEKMFANTRIWNNGVREVVNTGNLAMAMIPHHTSRDGDPNLHTHVYVMNGTMGPDGKWRSLSHEDLVHARWLGSYYRQKLAENAQALGYRTYATKDGFELEGYDRNQIEVFSKRHKAIEAKVIQMGLDLTPENKKKAVLTTRKAKRDSGKKLEDTQEVWREEGKPYGIGTLTLQEPIELQAEPGLMKRELDSAIAHLSERSVKFNEREIYQYVFAHIKDVKAEATDLAAEIKKHPSLIKTKYPGEFITVEDLEREIETRNLWMAGQGKAQPLKAQVNLKGTSLNEGQAEAVVRTLTSTDMHQIWHGFPGTGKTTAFKALKAELDGKDIVIRGFATTIEAAAELEKELGIKTNTVQHLVFTQPENIPNQLWIVDEVGMLGTKDMLTMQRQADAVGARIIIAGDPDQNPSIKAGSPLRSLMKHGATTHSLREIVRQQNDIQKQAVELIANGDGPGAIKLLNQKGYVSEIEDPYERASAFAKQYLSYSQRERDRTLMVTGTNAERLRITEVLRNGLKKEGSLSESIKVVKLVSRQLTDEQKRRIENYDKGDYIQFRTNYAGTALQKGQLYKVEKRDGHELVVSSFGGRMYRLDPAKQKDKDVFYATEMEIAVGDRLRWTVKDKEKGRTNGRHLTVTAIGETTMTVKDVKTRKTQEVSLLQPLPLDYNWVITTYKSQGATFHRTIGSETNDPTSSRESSEVLISRQKHELFLYAQNLEKLMEWVGRSNAQENPLDLIGEDYAQLRHDSPNPSHDRTPGERGDESLDPSTQGIDANNPSRNLANGQQEELSAELTLNNDSTLSLEGVEPSTNLIGENHGNDRHAEPSTGDRPVESELRDLSESATDHHWAERGNHSTEAGTAIERQGALEHFTAGSERTPQRIHRTTDRDHGRSEVGQNAGRDQASHQVDGQLDYEIGGQQHDSVTSQQSGDGSLRGNYGYESQFTQNSSAEISRTIEEWTTDTQWNENLERLAQAVQSVGWTRALNESGLDEQLTALNRQIDEFSPELAEPKFTRLPELAQQIENLQSQQTLSQSLTQIAASLKRLEEGLQQITRRLKLEAVDKGIRQWRAERSISEAVLEHRFEDAITASASLEEMRPDMERLAHAIGQWQSEQRLTQAIGQISVEIEKHALDKPFEQLERLAESIQSTKNERAFVESNITGKMVELTEVLEKDIVQPQFERLDELAQVLRTVQAKSTLLESGFVQQLESLNQRIEQFGNKSQIHEFPRLAELGEAIAQHQTQQMLSEYIEQISEMTLLLERNHLLTQFAELIHQRKTGQTLTEGAVIERFEGLAFRLDELKNQTQQYQFKRLDELATTIHDRRAEQAITERLEGFHRVATQVQEQLKNHPQLQQLADTIQALRNNPAISESPVSEQLQQIAQRLGNYGISVTPKPQKPEVFWVPDYSTAERPDHIDEKHWEEMKQSAIHPDLIADNMRSLEGEAVIDRLLSEKLATMGSGQYVTQPMAREIQRYEQLTEGGWWGTAGVDAKSLVNLQPGQQPTLSAWGCFKADNPRVDQDKTQRKGETEFIKYENPAGTERHLYLPHVPDAIAQQIYDKHGVRPTAAERKSGFWFVVINHPEIPVTLTEGLKKTLASLSQGEVTIGLAGVNALYRARDENKEKLPERLLNKEIAIFAAPRNFTFAFDQDAKTSTIFNVRRELIRGAELLEDKGSSCKIAKWKPELGKGLDDYIANQGPKAYTKALANAEPTDKEKRTYYRTEYNAIARQVKKAHPDISSEALNVEVYIRAIAKGEPKDGDRFLSQSDQARTLKDPEQVTAYIEQVKAAVPAYVRQQREIVAVRAQQAQEQERARAEYVAIAQQVHNEWGNIPGQRVDIEVYLKVGKNGDQLLAQSDYARSLSNPDQVKQYIETIYGSAPQYHNAKALYTKLASSIKKAQGALMPYRLDLEIQFQAQHENIKDLDKLLIQSDVTKVFYKEDPIKAQRYIKAIGELATLYESLRQSPNQEAVNQNIPNLVHKKLIDPEAIRRLREAEEELRRQQQGPGIGVDGFAL